MWLFDLATRPGQASGRNYCPVNARCGLCSRRGRPRSDDNWQKGLGRDPDVQALEDCACLVFLENYFADFSRKIEHDHMVRIVQMTWRKMSPRAHELALALPMSDASLALVKEALGAE
ncbi:hypothetical protein HSBAA_42230 [Vreelandella sulfidaeris]|uniref:DUF4202 domain-containing protein n=1 Tax=Vreelandella sulfidaeris TaxID=115553 RepID=A0A455UBF0_9GAMM|nr:hypothetical protein HSBAA_42230 [Halomonas sulfidaeris]